MYDHYYSKKRTIQFKNNRLTQRKNKKKLATRMAGLRLNIYTKCTFFSFFIHIYKIPATHTINTKNSVFCECLRAYRKCFRLLKSQNVKLNMKKKWLQRRKYFRKKSETHIHTYAYQRLEKNGRNYTFLSVMHKKKT